MTSAEWSLWLARARVEGYGPRRLEEALIDLLFAYLRSTSKAIRSNEVIPDPWAHGTGSPTDLKAKMRVLADLSNKPPSPSRV